MSITVKPDPEHPLGGHALLIVRGRPADGPVSVSVLDLYEDRHLGPKGWQPAPVALGPYAAYEEGDALVVPVGPEVVDHVEEYATLRLTVAGVSAELAWPETIRMSPRRTAAQPVPPRIDGKAPPKAETPPPPPPEPEPQPAVVEPEPPVGIKDSIEPVKSRSAMPLILAALVLLALIGGGVWWYLNQPEPVIEEAVTPPPPVQEETRQAATPPGTPGCDGAGLTAAAALPPAEGFAAVAACGAEGDPEARFRIIEAAAEAGVGEAIAMIGRWYDPAEAAAVGSNFSRQDPAQAARYFKDALAAGYAEAEALLARACGALNPDADPTHEIARELYCPRP